LVGTLAYANTTVAFGDGLNTYSMRNLADGAVLASTFITWDDANDNNSMDAGEEFLEMDVVHNSLIKWGTDVCSSHRPSGGTTCRIWRRTRTGTSSAWTI